MLQVENLRFSYLPGQDIMKDFLRRPRYYEYAYL